jgi:hypothetical protein
MPQLFKPIIEERFNMSTFRGSPVVPRHLEKLEPSQQYSTYTSDTMRLIGKHLNISPIKMEHYFTGYLSTLGMMFLSAADVVTSNISDYPVKPSGGSNPFKLGILNRKTTTKHVDRFYELYDEIDTAFRTFNSLVKEGDTKGAMEYRKENRSLIGMRPLSNKVQKTLSDINGRINRIRLDKTLSPKEKEARIDTLYKLKDKITKQAVTTAQRIKTKNKEQ